MNNPDIRYVNYGLGSNFGDYIELNENLQKYPKLHAKILKHEMGHSSKSFSKHDFVHDLQESKVPQLDLLKFMLRHPKSFTQLVPVYWSKSKGWVFDPNMIITYTFFFGALGLATWGLLKFF